MKTSSKGIELIKRHEGLRLQAYRCPAGVLTIGYGHTKSVQDQQVITLQQAESLLLSDLNTVEQKITEQRLKINQNQFDALASFVFNVGTVAFYNSTLLKKVINNSDDPSIANEFRRWVYAGGVISKGLQNRREAEIRLYYGMV